MYGFLIIMPARKISTWHCWGSKLYILSATMTRPPHHSYIITGIAAVLLSILLLHLVYTTIDKKHPTKTQTQKEYLGDIETPWKKWLNGHLGVFFGFKQLGSINWLTIPLLIWFFTTKKIKKRERWQWALLFVWLLTLVFIGIKGYYNPRYQLTLFPFTSAMVLFLSWKFLENKDKAIKILGFSFVTLVCLFNIYHYIDLYKTYWELRVSVKNPHFPYQLTDYLNSAKDISDKSKVLTINQPIFYYHIPRKGVDYVSPGAIGAWVEFKKKTSTVHTRNRLYQLLKKKLKVGYILLNTVYRRFHRSTAFEEFLHCECKPIIKEKGWLLYRLKDNSLEERIKSLSSQEIKVWNGTQPTIQTISPPLLRFSRRGIFKFEVSKDKGKNIIIVRNTRAKKSVKKRIQLGYEFLRKGLNIEASKYEGKYVTFIVRTAISPNLVNRENCIAIVDYNQDGSQDLKKTFFTTKHWRTYVVFKKVRPGNSRLVLMFRFSPLSTTDRIRIKDVKIVLSGEPL
jgi:hypothetical protein